MIFNHPNYKLCGNFHGNHVENSLSSKIAKNEKLKKGEKRKFFIPMQTTLLMEVIADRVGTLLTQNKALWKYYWYSFEVMLRLHYILCGWQIFPLYVEVEIYDFIF